MVVPLLAGGGPSEFGRLKVALALGVHRLSGWGDLFGAARFSARLGDLDLCVEPHRI